MDDSMLLVRLHKASWLFSQTLDSFRRVAYLLPKLILALVLCLDDAKNAAVIGLKFLIDRT